MTPKNWKAKPVDVLEFTDQYGNRTFTIFVDKKQATTKIKIYSKKTKSKKASTSSAIKKKTELQVKHQTTPLIGKHFENNINDYTLVEQLEVEKKLEQPIKQIKQNSNMNEEEQENFNSRTPLRLINVFNKNFKNKMGGKPSFVILEDVSVKKSLEQQDLTNGISNMEQPVTRARTIPTMSSVPQVSNLSTPAAKSNATDVGTQVLIEQIEQAVNVSSQTDEYLLQNAIQVNWLITQNELAFKKQQQLLKSHLNLNLLKRLSKLKAFKLSGVSEKERELKHVMNVDSLKHKTATIISSGSLRRLSASGNNPVSMQSTSFHQSHELNRNRSKSKMYMKLDKKSATETQTDVGKNQQIDVKNNNNILKNGLNKNIVNITMPQIFTLEQVRQVAKQPAYMAQNTNISKAATLDEYIQYDQRKPTAQQAVTGHINQSQQWSTKDATANAHFNDEHQQQRQTQTVFAITNKPNTLVNMFNNQTCSQINSSTVNLLSAHSNKNIRRTANQATMSHIYSAGQSVKPVISPTSTAYYQYFNYPIRNIVTTNYGMNLNTLPASSISNALLQQNATVDNLNTSYQFLNANSVIEQPGITACRDCVVNISQETLQNLHTHATNQSILVAPPPPVINTSVLPSINGNYYVNPRLYSDSHNNSLTHCIYYYLPEAHHAIYYMPVTTSYYQHPLQALNIRRTRSFNIIEIKDFNESVGQPNPFTIELQHHLVETASETQTAKMQQHEYNSNESSL